MTVSVVIPVYNEEQTVTTIVREVLKQPHVTQLIIVNDCSTDGTWQKMQDLESEDSRIEIYQHEMNQGKGGALRTAFKYAKQDVVIIQDADLEYDPREYPVLLAPIFEDKADVVFGSRFLSGGPHRVLYFWHYVANTFLTLLSNMFTNMNLTDMETCYKVFRREILQQIDLKENRFGIEPELTAKIAKLKVRIFEVGISYYGRTFDEGKKIGWKDGFAALRCIIQYNFLNNK
ncbi:MAG: glycosyltransferase family 2 protein [Verrucomicrobiota bacterium]